MKNGISINGLFCTTLIIAVMVSLTSCASIHAKDQHEKKETHMKHGKSDAISNLAVKEVIANSLSTFAIDKEGNIRIITPDFKVLDSKKLKPAPNNKIHGEVVNFSTISLFATKGSPYQMRVKIDDLMLCFLIDDETNAYLGACPR